MRMNRRIGEMAKRRVRPFAHAPIRRFTLLLPWVLVLGFTVAAFAQDGEEEHRMQNPTPAAL